MPNPVVKDFTLGEVTLVDGDSLPEKSRLFAQAMGMDSLALIPSPMRCSEEECLGDIASIILAAFNVAGDLVGVVSISTISILEQEGNLLKVRAVVLPYFPGVSDELATVEALFARLFSDPVDLANGTQIAILDLTEFKRLKVLDPNVPREARIAAIIQKIEDAGVPEILPDPANENAEIVRVRRSA